MNADSGKAQMRPLARLLEPHSIAVIGGGAAEALLRWCGKEVL